MIEDRLLYSVKDGVARVTLNRPDKHNGLDMAMYYALDSVIRKIRKDESIRVVIVNGEGPSFCSGLDFKSVMKKKLNIVKLLWKWNPFSANIVQRVSCNWRLLKVPVIMALHGKCWGGGMQIAMGGDFRIADQETSLALMEAHFGLMPDMAGTLMLKRHVPVDQAMKLAMLGDPISAQEGLSMHLITQIADDSLKAAERLAETLLARSPKTNAAIKSLYYRAPRMKDGVILARESFEAWRTILRHSPKG